MSDAHQEPFLEPPGVPSLAAGRALVIAAAVLWSTSGLFIKSGPLQTLSLNDRGPFVACYRALFAGVFLLPFVRWKRARLRMRMIPMVVSFAAMNALFVTAMTYTTAAGAIFLQYTATGWAFLFGAVFLREPVTRANLIALAFCFLGIGWIVASEWNGAQFLGTTLALGSGLAYGGVVVSLRALRDEDGPWLIALNHLVSGIVLLPWALSRSIAPTGEQWLIIAGLGILQMAVPYVLFSRGVRSVTAQEAGLITLLEAVLNPLWVWAVWGERVPRHTAMGGGLILAGLIVKFAWRSRDSEAK